MDKNGLNTAVPGEDLPVIPPERDAALFLDDRLNAAAKPFLYLLTSVITAVSIYLLYRLVYG